MKKNILITSNLYRPNIGGVENSLYHLAFEYEALGYNVAIVSSDMNNVTNEVLPAEEKLSEFITIYRYRVKDNSIPKFIYMYISSFRLYKKLLNKYNGFDNVIARSHFNVIGCKLAGMKNICYLLPGVVINQNSNSNLSKKTKTSLRSFLYKYYHHFLQKIAVNISSKNFVFSENMRGQTKKFLTGKVENKLVKPGVDINRFHAVSSSRKSEIRLKLGLPEDKKIILGLGRFVNAKGFDLLTGALKFLSDDEIIVLVGSGVEKDLYLNNAKALGKDKYLFVHDPTPEPELYYKASDVFAMTSIYEPLGQTILEAQSCGLPVVAFSPNESTVLTATNEVTFSFSCFYSIDCNSKSLALSILKALDSADVNSKLSHKISQATSDKFSWKKLAKEMVNT
ncbi:glycosyltransferase family 4 protein [Vibrio cyclitrophicus]|uniref:glycosyltransferase family 4 protein n=1 Tax=Vibrio cyclitrophicus TaxID=47951 RepID=UPI000C84F938|nr:glycosyltransferase [Vibrio cyclitrophicus]PMK96684.1 hypothetical protein BCT87_09320 [Vibrio cyclitrophicus]